MWTVRPSRRVMINTPCDHDVRTPTVSENTGRPSAISASLRTDTRLPTSAGVMRLSDRASPENVKVPPARRFVCRPGTEILEVGIDDAALPREMSPTEEERQRDLRHRAALCRREGQGVHRGVPR